MVIIEIPRPIVLQLSELPRPLQEFITFWRMARTKSGTVRVHGKEPFIGMVRLATLLKPPGFSYKGIRGSTVMTVAWARMARAIRVATATWQ
jgi:hypothetical protein